MGSTFSRTKKFHQTKNFHPNFVDKVPEMRRNKLMKKVKGMLDIIDADLIARVKKERQKNFVNELDAGK